MKNLIIILAIFLSMPVSYQFTYSQWVQRYDGGDDIVSSIAVDDSGNVYVTGTSGNGYATIKYSSSGVQQWIQRYIGNGGKARSIALDGSGNVYVTGYLNFGFFSSSVTIKYSSSGAQQWVRTYNGGFGYSIAVDDSGNVYVTGWSYPNNDYITIKYNSNGDSLWVRRYNGPGNSEDRANFIAVDGSGNVYVTGQSRSSFNYDYATIKYNSNGDSLWVRRYNGQFSSDDIVNSIAVDDSGNVFVTGQSGHANDHAYATIKYNSSGVQQWVQIYNGPGNSHDEASSIAVDNSGDIYVTGSSYAIPTSTDYTTIKYNSNGDSLWVRRYNGPLNASDGSSSIALDDLGNVYVTGGSVGIGTYSDYATIKYNSLGDVQWVQRYDGPGNYGDGAGFIAVDNSGNVYVTGASTGIHAFTTYNYDYATIKYSQQPTFALGLTALIQGFYTNITQAMIRDTVRVYLRDINSPYSIVDSATSVLDSTGYGTFYFPNAVNGTLYYIVVKHRNSIETWSNQGKMFTSYQLSYDFITAANKAYGGNLILKGKYCIYSGDVNQDGIVDAGDLSLVDNDAFNSVSGYVITDVTGDNIIDGSDLAITDNNAFNFVAKVTP